MKAVPKMEGLELDSADEVSGRATLKACVSLRRRGKNYLFNWLLYNQRELVCKLCPHQRRAAPTCRNWLALHHGMRMPAEADNKEQHFGITGLHS